MASLSTDLAAYWALDEASGTATDLVASLALADNGGVTTAAGKVSTARSFASASSQYLSVADNATVSMGDIGFTIRAWVYLTDKSVTRSIVSKWTSGSYEYVLYYDSSGDKFSCFVTNNGAFGASANVADTTLGSPSLNTWYQIHFWHDATNNLVGISTNAGTAVTTSYSSGVFNGTAAFKIGSHDGGSYWSGRIDEVAIWKNRVLTLAERILDYNGGSGWDYASIQPRSAHVYYFSSSGSDSNTGLTTGDPFQTISKANSLRITAGDSFLFKKGDTFTSGPLAIAQYAGGDTPTALLPCVVGAYSTGAKPIISCGDNDGVTFHDLPYITISDIDVEGSGVTFNANGNPPYNDSTWTTTGFGIWAKNTTGANLLGVVIDGNTVVGTNRGILLGDWNGTAHSFGYTGFQITNNIVDQIVISGIDCNNLNTNSPPIHLDGVFSGNTISNVYGDGINNTGYGLTAGCGDGILMEGNLVKDCGAATGPFGSGGPVGIMFAGIVDGIIRGNVVLRQKSQGQDGAGIHMDGSGNDGCIIEGNYVADSDSHNYTVLSLLGAGTVDTILRHNISVRGGGFLLNYAAGTIAHNNTAYVTGAKSLLHFVDTTVKVYNNVFITGTSAGIGTAVTNGSDVEGNLYDCATFGITYNSVLYTSLADFRTGSGQESSGHGFATAAGLDDATNGPTNPLTTDEVTEFDPASGSSAVVGTGLNILSLFSVDPGTLDYHGLTNHPTAGYAIGAVASPASTGARRRRLICLGAY